MTAVRILIIGTGGVGGYYGARLLASGHDVHFLSRGDNLQALQAHGLQIRSECGDLQLTKIVASQVPSETFEPDLCIFAVKNYDLKKVCALCAPTLKEKVILMSLQNGVSAPDVIKSYFPHNLVLAGLTYTNLQLLAPGVINHIGRRADIHFGSFVKSDLSAVQTALRQAGINATVHEDIRTELWKKLTFIAPISGTTCFFRSPIGLIRQSKEQWNFCLASFQEAIAIARLYAPGLPISIYEDHVRAAENLSAESSSSMFHDLMARKPIELEWLSGEIVRSAHAKGHAAPIHREITKSLEYYVPDLVARTSDV